MISPLHFTVYSPIGRTAGRASYGDVKMQAPAERSAPCIMRARAPSFWPDEHAARLNADVPAAHQILAKPRVMQHVGEVIGQAHRASIKLHWPVSDLKVRVESEQSWQVIKQSPVLSALSPIEPLSALLAIEEVGDKLWHSTPERVETAYYLSPGAMRVKDDGTIIGTAQHSGTGFHAWFEPLAQLDHATQAERGTFAMAVDAYIHGRDDIPASDKVSWPIDALRCRVLFDLMQVSQVLAHVPQLLPSEKEHYQESYKNISRLQTLLPRLSFDLTALGEMDGSAPTVVYVTQPYLYEN